MHITDKEFFLQEKTVCWWQAYLTLEDKAYLKAQLGEMVPWAQLPAFTG